MMVRPLLLLATCLFWCLPLLAQINDCADARIICSSDNLEFNPDGPGNNDFADPDNLPGCITALEQNSAWYYFEIDPTAPPNLVLGFIIHPNGGYGEDYDWALFGPNVSCGDLGAPIRCSSSSFMCGFCPETGMGMGTTDFSEGPGSGDGFVSTLVVQPGQGFYLMIDNWLGTTNGFVLEWTDSAAPWLNCDASPPCALEAVAGGDLAVCEGEQVVHLIGDANGNHGNEIYNWSGSNGGTAFLDDPDSQNPDVNLPEGFSGTITFTLTVTEDTCTSFDLVDLMVNPLPNVSINPAGPYCQNANAQDLTGTPPGGTWSGAVTGNQFVPMNHPPGVYTVHYTYTDNHGCMNSADMDIEVYGLPEVAITPDPAEFCDSEGSVLLTATGSNGAGNYTYAWTTPTGMGDENTYAATVSGAHVVTVTDDNGCSSTSSVNVVTYANPSVQILDPGPLCQSLDFFLFSAVPPGGMFDGSVVDPGGEISPSMVAPGAYSVTYTYEDIHHCASTASLNFSVVPVPNAIADNTGPVCMGEQFQLLGYTDFTGLSVEYLWTGPGGYTSDELSPVDATLSGIYEFQVIVDGCPSMPAVTAVEVVDPPEALPDNGGPYCTGSIIQLFGNTTAMGSNITFVWTGPGGYTSSVQNPVDAVLPGTYTLVVKQGGCVSAPQQTVVVFSTPPDAMATNNGPYCAGESIALFGSTMTGGANTVYAWTGPGGYQSASQNPVDASQPGNYQLIITIDGCASTPANTNVVIYPLPQPSITGKATFCTGFSSVLDAGGGFAQYVWNDNSTGQMLTATSSGTYSVTVTDANGCTGSASIDVTELASLSPVISGLLSFCEGSQTTLDAGPGYTSYQWSSGEFTQAITATEERVYRVTVTDADGCTGATSVTTTIHDNPDVMIGGSTTYCIGGYTILDAGNGYADYLWSNDSITQQIKVTVPGTFSVNVIDVNGCTGSASVDVNESTSLSPVITGLPAFCENGTTTLNAGSGFAIYAWSDGSDQPTLLVNTSGVYAVTVTDSQACSGSSSVMVTEVAPPDVQFNVPPVLCNTTAGGSLINLYSLISSGDMNGIWSDDDQSGAAGDFDQLDFDGVNAGAYRFSYTTNSAIAPCPESGYTITVTIMDCTCPDVFFYAVPDLCNNSGTLDLTSIENTQEPGTWSIIQTPAGSQSAALNGTVFNAAQGDPGTYTLLYTLSNASPPGCPGSFEVTVDVDASVYAGQAVPPVSFCEGENITLMLKDMLTGADANGVWKENSVVPSQGGAFNAAAGTFSTNGQKPGDYTFQYDVSGGGACPDDSETVKVTIDALPIAVIQPFGALDCEDPVQSLDASGSSEGALYSITWTGPGVLQDGKQTTLHPTIDKAGHYVLTIIQTQTGCQQTASIDVVAYTDPPAGAVVSIHDPSCYGEQDGNISVANVMGGTPPFMYALNGGPSVSNPDFRPLSAGPYDLQIVDVNGCRWDTTIVLAEPQEINLSLGPDIEIQLGETANVQATVNIPVDLIDTLIWSPAEILACIDDICLEGTVQTYQTIQLQVTLLDVNGCKVADQILIQVDKNRHVYIPTTFSPNEDGINDLFYIFGDEDQIVRIKTFRVFNRWGELVHEAKDFKPNDPQYGWNGKFHDVIVNPGVFVYLVEVEFIDGVTVPYRGDVTVLR